MSKIPAYHNPDQNFTYYVLVPHYTETQVLLLPGRTLPHFTPVEQHLGVVGHINRAIGEQLGITVSTLRCVYQQMQGNQGMRVYALDNLSPDWTPPAGATWVTCEALLSMPLVPPELNAAVQDYFDWLAEDSALRVPWSRRGWFVQAAAWIETELVRLHIVSSGPVEQVRAWARSCILRVPTVEGWLYFKAVPAHFSYEPVITRVLDQRYPDQVTQVLAVDVDKGWMLMRDFGRPTLSRTHDLHKWEQAIQQYAQIQIDLIPHVSALISIGCPDRPVDQLVAQIDRFFGDKNAMFPGTEVDLTAAEVEELISYAHTLKVMCYDLLEYKVPLSLEHGDLWANNIAMQNDRFVYFDWSDVAITHPFFSLLFFLAEIEIDFPEMPDVRERLLRAYLTPWIHFETIEDLLHATQLAQPLAALHHAIVYYANILPNIETQACWEMENMLPYYLRKLLDLLRAQTAP